MTDETAAATCSATQNTEQPWTQSPVVQQLAGDNNIGLATVPSAGAVDRITCADVETFIDDGVKTPNPAAVAQSRDVKVPLPYRW